MEPPKPDRKSQVLQNAPNATPEDYDEYEKLLAARYAQDPSSFAHNEAAGNIATRLQELTEKLFGKP